VARQFGATHVFPSASEAIEAIHRLTSGRGADAAIEALGTQETFEAALRSIRAGGRVSSVGVYSGHLNVPLDALHAGLGDHTLTTALCPGGKERMARLMRLVESHRIDLRPLLTHVFAFEEIAAAYELFGSGAQGVVKVAIRVN
jgi:threonine dehydrogenase-like Zn-dependent dehydrogenase